MCFIVILVLCKNVLIKNSSIILLFLQVKKLRCGEERLRSSMSKLVGA